MVVEAGSLEVVVGKVEVEMLRGVEGEEEVEGLEESEAMIVALPLPFLWVASPPH
jgi:hypothetical protein